MTQYRQIPTSDKDMNIALIDYPGALKSALWGLDEMFSLANSIEGKALFTTKIIEPRHSFQRSKTKHYHAIFIPPSIEKEFILNPDQTMIDWLIHHYKKGSTLCSACAGAFIIAATGILDNKKITTHWNLEKEFKQQYPSIALDTNKILIRNDNIITAGGMMSWVDLGLNMISQLASSELARRLGKTLVIDTGHRQQSYYQQFLPECNHGDAAITKAQTILHSNIQSIDTIATLASLVNMTERTLLRRFSKATGINPREYIIRLKIQKVCDLLESSNNSFERIAYEVGYNDISSCRKSFVKIMGLTPKEFRKRFIGQSLNDK